MVEVLIVDDDDHIRESLKLYLKEKGYEVLTAADGNRAWFHINHSEPRIVILDIRLPDVDGIELLRRIKSLSRDVQVIMVTAFQNMETTIMAMKLGACEYIHKPIDINELDSTMEKLRETLYLNHRLREFSTGEYRDYKVNHIVGRSNAIKEIFKIIGLVCESKTSILVQGESGTGKELISKVIHDTSPCRDEPFVPINCSALPEALLESELFGHEKGAFTGAISTKKGKFELAQNGTIFLDEIGEISPSVQVKLLRFLQDKEFERLGGEKKIFSNARIIAATNKNLQDLVEIRKFREDLYFRLKVVTINVPPLRERRSDIPYLVEYLLNKINRELGKDVRKIPEGVINSLIEYDWPGNVRELENVLTRAVLLAKGEVLLQEYLMDFLKRPTRADDGASDGLSLEEVEKKHILQILRLTNWNRGRSCKILKISRPTLRHKMKLYQIRHS